MRKRSLCVAASLLVAPLASASPVDVRIIGHVTGISGSAAAGASPTVKVNDTFDLKFSFEPYTTAATTGATRSLNAIAGSQGSIGGYAFTGITGDAFVRNNNSVSGIFNGNPYDQLTLNINYRPLNQAGYGVDRDDFSSTSGNLGGHPLRSIAFTMQTDDTAFLDDLNYDAAAWQGVAARLTTAQVFLSASWSTAAFGETPIFASSAVDSVTVTPEPSAVLSLALLAAPAVLRRRRTR